MNSDYSSTSVAELRRMLIESKRFTEEEVSKIKGKSNLVTALLEVKNGEEELGEPDFTKFINSVVEQPQTVSITKELTNVHIDEPDYNSTEWHDYVMSQFRTNELEDGNYPNIYGLRRVSELLLGPILQSGPTELYPPSSDDQGTGRSSCVYTVVFDSAIHGKQVEFRAAAGASPQNMDDAFNIFPEAIAEVRAEARALRKALKIRCVSSEEIKRTNCAGLVVKPETSSTGEWSETDSISTPQVMFIKTKCKESKIDLSKFINHNGWNYETLEATNKKVAMDMIALLNDYGSTKKNTKIPEEILIN